MLEKSIVSWLTSKQAKLIHLLLILVPSLIFALWLPRLSFNFELEKLFPTQDEDLKFFNEHVKTFGYDNDNLSALLIAPTSTFDTSYHQLIKQTSDALKRIDGVKVVWSPLNFRRLVPTPTGIVSFELFETVSNTKSDSLYVLNDPFLSESFGYGNFLPISLEHDHLTDQKEIQEFHQSIVNILENTGLRYHLLGKIAAQEEFNNYIRSDFGLFIALSIIICIAVLWLLFKDLASVALPLTVCMLTLLWVFGAMAMLGIPISIMTSLIPPLMLFVASSDSVHLLSSLQTCDNKGEAVKKVLLPTFFTSLTTCCGFISLWWIPVAPLGELGILCGIGTMVAFVVTYLFVPYLHDSLRKPGSEGHGKKLLATITSNRKAIYFSFGLLAIAGVSGTIRLQSNAFLLQDLPETSRVRQSFEFGDRVLGGSKPWEMAISITDPGSNIWSSQVIAEVDKITNYLEETYQLAAIKSPSKVLSYADYLHFGGELTQFSRKSVNTTRQILRRQDFKLIAPDQRTVRITGLIPETGSRATIAKNDSLIRFLDQHIDQSIISYRLTGTNYLIDKSNALLARYMMQSILIAIGIVSVLLALYFRSIRVAFIALIPNLLPLVVVGGIVYALDIPIQFSTSIIFALTFGIVVDDTIHFLATYFRATGTIEERLASTMDSAGSGILNTTLILVSGFAILTLSSFGATFYLGLFLSSSLLFALFTDLLLLPLLIKSFKL